MKKELDGRQGAGKRNIVCTWESLQKLKVKKYINKNISSKYYITMPQKLHHS